MKPGHIHLAIPPQQIPPSFARAVSPGCPTDGVTISQDFLPPWVTDDKAPRTTTSILRSTSWNSVETHPQAATTAIWRVEPGSFVTFALDTAAVAAKFPEGSEAYKEILSMPVGRYVGFVSSSYGYQDDADEFVEELIVNYVGSAMPPLEELSTHWVPVSPSSKLDWSPGISPLQTTRMFPWKDRLLWTTLGTRLDMTHFHGSLLRFALSDDEFAKFEDKASVDYGSGVTSLIDVDDPMYKLRIPQFKIPAQIWQDIRGVDISEDPTLFTAEVENLERCVLSAQL